MVALPPEDVIADALLVRGFPVEHVLGEHRRTVHGGPYDGRRRAGARPGGWAGASRAGEPGIGHVTGSSGARVTVAPWCATSSGAPRSRV